MLQYDQSWLSYAIPSKSDSFEKCFRYAPVNISENSESLIENAQCDEKLFDTTKRIECTEFVYRTDEKNVMTEVRSSLQK